VSVGEVETSGRGRPTLLVVRESVKAKGACEMKEEKNGLTGRDGGAQPGRYWFFFEMQNAWKQPVERVSVIREQGKERPGATFCDPGLHFPTRQEPLPSCSSLLFCSARAHTDLTRSVPLWP
jgi:hypothetical protein